MSGLSEDEMRDEMQTDVTQYFSMMKDTINRKRKGLVAGAESFPGTMISGDALAAGLIDEIGTLEDAIEAVAIHSR